MSKRGTKLQILRQDFGWCSRMLYVWYWPALTPAEKAVVDYIWVIVLNKDGSTDAHTVYNSLHDVLYLRLNPLELEWTSRSWYNHIKDNPYG